jgi:hypothetical protein
MRFSCKLLNSDSYIRQNILQLLAKDVNNVFKRSVVSIEAKIKILIKDALRQQPEYLSLVNSAGDLRLNFGIEDMSIVDSAISNFAGSSSFDYKPVKISTVGLIGGFSVNFLPQSAIESASSSSSVITEKGQSLPWLSWLLYEGTSPIIRDYDIQIGNNPYSRTGGAIMVPSKRNWRVPASYAGTITNNWITRAIENKDSEIYSIIENTIRNNI